MSYHRRPMFVNAFHCLFSVFAAKLHTWQPSPSHHEIGTRYSYPYTGVDRHLGLQHVEVPRISRQSAREGGKVISLKQQSPFFFFLQGSRQLMPPDYCSHVAYCITLNIQTLTTSRLTKRSWQSEMELNLIIFRRSNFHHQSSPRILVAKGGTMWVRNGR